MQLFSGNLHRAERREWPGNLHKADLPVGVTWSKKPRYGAGRQNAKVYDGSTAITAKSRHLTKRTGTYLRDRNRNETQDGSRSHWHRKDKRRKNGETNAWRILVAVPVALAGKGRAPASSHQSLLPKRSYFHSRFPEHNSICYHYALLR